MPKGFQPWPWASGEDAPKPEDVIIVRNQLIELRNQFHKQGDLAWAMILNLAAIYLTYYAERERRN